MNKLVTASISAIAAGAALALPAAAQTSTLIEDNIPAAPVNYELETIAEGIMNPGAIAFVPNGDILVNSKSGDLWVIRDDMLLEPPVANMPPVMSKDQASMLDIALHPDFEENSLIYLSYSHGDESANGTRLARARYVPDETGASMEDFEVLFTADPLKEGGYHYGGRIVFLDDGTLLLSIGEGYRYMRDAPKLDTHYGKIVRLNDDGSVPADNPFVDDADAKPEIWTYGHRNPQGLYYDAENDIVYEHEHGPRGGDEVNIIEPGNNYGWPVITYGIDYSGAVISPLSEMDGMEQPVIHFVPSIAPSGLTMYHGTAFPDWEGDLFIGALAHKHVRRVDLGEDGSFGDQQELFTELDARIRDVETGPDGYLYILTDEENGKAIRVKPAQ